MGRSIKFRAWNDTQKTMGEAFALQDARERRRDGVRTGDVIHMQFTGLTDKNGVEIYERDILSSGARVWAVRWGCGLGTLTSAALDSMLNPTITLRLKTWSRLSGMAM